MNEKAMTNPELPEKMSSLKPDILTVAGYAFAYFMAHQIAFFFPDSEKVIAAIWPAGGIGLVAFLLSPYRLWPWLFLSFYIGGIGADVLLNNRSFFAGVGYMTGNMVESLGCAWLIIKWCGRDLRFTRVKEVLALITGTVFVNAVSTCIGTGTAVLSRNVSFQNIWIEWYIADGLGILLITPLIVTWAKIKDVIPRALQGWVIEMFIFTVLWVTAAWFSFQPSYISKPLAPHYYMLIALLAWPALRLGQQTVSLSLVLLALIAITSKAVSEGPSPCGGDNFTDRLLLVQVYLGITAFAGFLLNAVHAESKAAEQTAHEEQSRISALGDNLPNGMVYQVVREHDGTRRFLYVSAGVEKMNGVSAAEVLRDSSALYNLILQDDRAKVVEAEEVSAREMSVFNVVARFRLPNGQIRWMDISSTPRRLPDGRVLWDGIQTDVTEHKQMEEAIRASEKRYRETTDFLPVSIFEIDATGRLVSVNQTALNVFKYNNQDFNEDMNALQFFAPEERQRVGEDMGKAIRGTSIPGQEYAFMRKDGSTFIGLIYSSPIIHQNNTIGLRGAIIDITDRKRAEQQLGERVKELRAFYTLSELVTREGITIEELCREFSNILPKSWQYPEITCARIVIDGKEFHTENFAESSWMQSASIKVQGSVRGRIDVGYLGERPEESEGPFLKEERMLIDALAERLGHLIASKQAEETLQESEDKYRNLFHNANEAIFVAQDDKLVFSNPMTSKMIGYSIENLMARPFTEFIHPDDRGMVSDRHVSRIKGEEFPDSYSFRVIRKDGEVRWGEQRAVAVDWEGKPATLNFMSDITERKLMEEKLRNSTAQLSNALAIAHLGHWEYDIANDLFTFNDQFYNIFRTTVEQVGGYTMHSAEYANRFVHPDDRDMVGEEIRKAIETTDPNFNRELEHRIVYADGTVGYITVRFFIVKDSHGRTIKAYGVNQDITGRKQAEETLRESERKYRELVENANSIILRWSPSGEITFLNEFGLKFFGYTEEEILGRHVVGTIVPETESTGRDLRPLMDIITADPSTFEHNINENIRRNGERAWISWTNKAVLDSEGHLLEVLSIGADITERKRAEESLRKSEEKFTKAFKESPISISISSTVDERLIEVNEAFEKIMGYTREEALASTLIDMGLWVNRADRERLLPIFLANGRLRNEEVQFRTKSGEVVTCLLSAELIELEGEKCTLATVENITDRKDMIKRLQLTMESLQRAVSTTVQVIASTVEARDPYTAGHQIRVADLACAIATEMGLPSEKIEGIRMAGAIHDLGKISIPAELLSKPTKLDELEFAMIKTHSQKGYRILKDVESSWPLAEIVYQHHERMDGSGYPRNLKGVDILIEARILTVADVVEAMASHRPYRVALGIDTALTEIEKNSGIFYDKSVADACLRLFREKGYQLAVA